ncbi:hypothetical protein ACIRVK_03325 [Streptomyces sp. NPDC101152]|uniref:hypothetical protein n=1 Tax=Streptomyces sp. NPDC101152 TaxID=3366116 RepID=UPI0038110022
MTEPFPGGEGHTECDDESCPLLLLFRNPVFLRANVDMTAEAGWSSERLRELVLALGEAGPLPVTSEVRVRVDACSDPALLRAWAIRTLRATSLADLFAENVV